MADALAHPPVSGQPLFAGGEVPPLAVGQRNHAPGRAPPASDARFASVGVDQDELGRAAADVEDQGRAVAGLEQPVAAEHGKPRLFLGRDDLEADAGLAPHPLDEVAAVDRAAAGLGGDRTGEAHPAAAQFLGAYGQRGDGAVHRAVGKLARGRHAFAEPDDPRESVDHGETVFGGAGDQQSAIVGAKIDRAISVTRRPATGGTLGDRLNRFYNLRLRSLSGLLRHFRTSLYVFV